MMTFNRRLGQLRGKQAEMVIDSCLDAMRRGVLTSRHMREIERCEDSNKMDLFEMYLEDKDPFVRGSAAQIVVRSCPEKVVEAMIVESDKAARNLMIIGIEKAGCSQVDGLTQLLRRKDDPVLVDRIFNMFVKVGRADLLFALAMGGEDETVQRVRRYLDEQGWLEESGS